ncbi:MAG: hypothetical protein U5K00_01545 [Melioribacteraceae bacterium]|nr:hypothetical protein [Melioribacteraceae bacterium]
MATVEEFLGVSMTWGKLERSGVSTKTKSTGNKQPAAVRYKKV